MKKFVELLCPAELALKSRKEIADYLSQNKDDRARIRVSLTVVLLNWNQTSY